MKTLLPKIIFLFFSLFISTYLIADETSDEVTTYPGDFDTSTFEDEKYIDMATAVSASGPAYIAIVIESLIDAGVYIGLQREISKRKQITNHDYRTWRSLLVQGSENRKLDSNFSYNVHRFSFKFPR